MNVRRVVEVIVVDQPVAHVDDRIEIVDAERVGGPHRCDQRNDPPSLSDRRASGHLESVDADVVLQVRRYLDDMLLPEAEPAGDVQSAVMALRRRQDHPVAADAVVHRIGKRLLDAELGAVEGGAGPAEREDAGRPRRVVADKPGRHRGHRSFGQRETVGCIVSDEVRIVDGRQQ